MLAVGLPHLQDQTGRIQLVHARSGQTALEMLRVLEVDLVLVPHALTDMGVTVFVDQMLGAWPWQRWGLVGAPLTDRQEMAVRQRSVMGVFEHMPEVDAAA